MALTSRVVLGAWARARKPGERGVHGGGGWERTLPPGGGGASPPATPTSQSIPEPRALGHTPTTASLKRKGLTVSSCKNKQFLNTGIVNHVHKTSPCQHNTTHLHKTTDRPRFNKQIFAKFTKVSNKHKTVYVRQVTVADSTQQATQPRIFITLSCSSSKAQAQAINPDVWLQSLPAPLRIQSGQAF